MIKENAVLIAKPVILSFSDTLLETCILDLSLRIRKLKGLLNSRNIFLHSAFFIQAVFGKGINFSSRVSGKQLDAIEVITIELGKKVVKVETLSKI